MRLAAAVKWYELVLITQGKAAELADLSRAAFINALADYGVSPLQVPLEELGGVAQRLNGGHHY